MSATILDGDAIAAQVRLTLRAEAAALAARGVRPHLASVLVGEDIASQSYIARKHADCAEIGITAEDLRFPADIAQAELIRRVALLSATKDVHGVLVQLPLPKAIDPAAVQAAIASAKDVDGLTDANLAALLADRPGLRPCTPSAILHLLNAYGIATRGRIVAIIGRGALVGRPLALMLAAPGIDASPILLHRAAGDLARVTRTADIVISAAGAVDLVHAEMIKPGAVVIGVGISYVDGVMRSDIAANVSEVASHVTPPHGSIGPLTRAMLMSNTLAAARAHASR